eukprot:Gb_05980 [translate_table: standard]
MTLSSLSIKEAKRLLILTRNGLASISNPSRVDTASLTSSEDERVTNPKPLDLPTVFAQSTAAKTNTMQKKLDAAINTSAIHHSLHLPLTVSAHPYKATTSEHFIPTFLWMHVMQCHHLQQ